MKIDSLRVGSWSFLKAVRANREKPNRKNRKALGKLTSAPLVYKLIRNVPQGSPPYSTGTSQPQCRKDSRWGQDGKDARDESRNRGAMCPFATQAAGEKQQQQPRPRPFAAESNVKGLQNGKPPVRQETPAVMRDELATRKRKKDRQQQSRLQRQTLGVLFKSEYSA